MRALVLFYSTYGYTYRLARAVAEGASEVKNSVVDISASLGKGRAIQCYYIRTDR